VNPPKPPPPPVRHWYMPGGGGGRRRRRRRTSPLGTVGTLIHKAKPHLAPEGQRKLVRASCLTPIILGYALAQKGQRSESRDVGRQWDS
jgi:hypothetical protein